MGSALHLRAARRLARIEAWERAIPLLERLRDERLRGIRDPRAPLAISMLSAALGAADRSAGVRLYNEIHPEAIDELGIHLSELMQRERNAAIEDLIELVRDLMERHHATLVGEAVAVARGGADESGAAHPHEATPRPVG